MGSNIVIVHSDKQARRYLEIICAVHHKVSSAGDIKSGIKLILQVKPAVVLVGLDSKKQEALQLMRYMKAYGSTIPVIVVGGRGAATLQMSAVKAGAKAFLELPVEQDRLDREVSKVLQAGVDLTDSLPPITDEEEQANLTELETRLNRRMKCPSGKNQVHLQSLIVGLRKTKPRISLKCALRADFALRPNVYYEYIRDVCCNDPSACPAVQQFQARNSA